MHRRLERAERYRRSISDRRSIFDWSLMYQSDTEILFPMRVAPRLRDLRGHEWREAVDRACQTEDASPDQLALSLVMIRLAGCLTCHSDSYRAIRGCTSCATASVSRFRGADSELEQMVTEAKTEFIEDRSSMNQMPEGVYQRSISDQRSDSDGNNAD